SSIGYAVKTLESKETRAQRNDADNAQFSLCCTSTRNAGFDLTSTSGIFLFQDLFFQTRHVTGDELPPPIAFDQRVRELHHTIERLAFGHPFHARFPEDNRRVVSVEPRFH